MARLRKPVRDFSRVKKHVVFFHGLNGSSDTTFLSSGASPEFWPDWLNDLGDEVAVWALDYGAAGTRWKVGDSMALPDRAQNILPLLANEPELSEGDIILIGHSLGGLVIKQLLRLAEDERGNDARVGNFIRRVRKVGFLATPHFGSDHATVANRFALIARPRETTAGLKRNDAHLRDLNRWYQTFSEKNKIRNLVLYETKSTSIRFGPRLLGRMNIGTIVKPDSADPGLPHPVSLIPVDADHWSIVRPIDRHSEVYVHIRDFVSEPADGVHADTYLSDRLESVSDAIRDHGATIEALRTYGDTRSREIVEALKEIRDSSSTQAAIAAGAENAVVGAELERRLTRLRKLRHTGGGFDSAKEARRLFEDLRSGELAAATRGSKRLASAWCARMLSVVDGDAARVMLDAADTFGTGEENDIAAVFIQLHRDNDKQSSLAKLASLDSPLARSALLFVAGHGSSRAEMLAWFDSSGLSVNDLDPEGKGILLQRRLETAQWSRALEEADTLQDEDFDASPILLIAAGGVHLSAAIHEDLRSAAVFHLPLDLANFYLATDAPSLARRRRARDLFERAVSAFTELGGNHAVAIAEDFALWLGLRDSTTRDEAMRTLKASMTGAPRSLRRVPFALQFGVNLDPVEVERQIDMQMTLTGGTSPEAAIARLALAQAKSDPGEVAEYIGKHREQLSIFFKAEWIDAIQVETLAHSGQISEARTKLAELQGRLSATEVQALQRIIDEGASVDPIALRESQYASSANVADLIVLVDMLRAKKAWPKLAVYGGQLFESTKDASTLRTYVDALYQIGDYSRIINLAEAYGEVFTADRLQNTLAWSHFRTGDISSARLVQDRLRASAKSSIDTWLVVNIAVTTGDWNALSSIVEEEWLHRSEREAFDLLQMGQLAALAGSGRAKELVKEAAQRANGDPSILAACYSEAVKAGWEDDTDVHQWLDEAIQKSGPDGPIQRMDIKQLLDMQPSWNERENRTWTELSAGRLPVFVAGLVLHRSLLDLYLTPAISNLEQSDPRRRPIIFAFSGTRRVRSVPIKKVAIDATTLLTLSFLGLLKPARGHFEQIVISPSMLSWLLEERRRIQFHQPSRVRAAFQVKRLLDNGSLKRFEPIGNVKPELEREVGADLALMLAAARDVAEGDHRQHVVVRSYPLHRAGTLMDQLADVSGYEGHLAGCRDVVSALKRLGRITTVEEERCTTYLGLHEKPWPHSPVINDGAVLLLDGLAVTYLQHLKLLDRLKAAGFEALVSVSDLAEGDALINHEAFADAAQLIIENIRSEVAEGVASGKITFGAFPRESDVDEALKNHPSTSFFELAPLVEGLIVDDRTLNARVAVATPTGPKDIFSTLDVLVTLRDAGAIGAGELGENLTRLRRAGYLLVPLLGEELSDWLDVAPVVDGRVVETAELRAIREAILRVRMTDTLQLPHEGVWLEGVSRALLDAIRGVWIKGTDEPAVLARSNWLLSLLDIRAWAHRTLPETSSLQRGYGAQAFMLISVGNALEEKRDRYWVWLEQELLARLRDENDESYAELIRTVEKLIAEAVQKHDEGGDE